MLAEDEIQPIRFRLKFLGSNYLTRALSNPHHPIIRSFQQMARVPEDPTNLLTLKVPWIYTCYTDIEPEGHLMAKGVRNVECSFPYQNLLDKKSVSFKQGEGAKAIPDGSK
jgi:hypothetical protein